MVVESASLPGREPGRYQPSQALCRRTIEKAHGTQLKAAFAELMDNIPRPAKERGRRSAKDPRGQTPTGMVDRVSSIELFGNCCLLSLQETIICQSTEYISLIEARNQSLLEERRALQAKIAAFEILFPKLMDALRQTSL